MEDYEFYTDLTDNYRWWGDRTIHHDVVTTTLRPDFVVVNNTQRKVIILKNIMSVHLLGAPCR